MNPPGAQVQKAMQFFQALPGLVARGEMQHGEVESLTLPVLAALALRHGYPVGTEALAEAFRIRMLARLATQRRV